MTNEMTEIKLKMVDKFEGVPVFLRDIVRSEMVRIWNIGAEASEELYRTWNSEFKSLYGDGHYESPKYDKFLEGKWRKWYSTHTHSAIFDLEKTEIEDGMAIFKIRWMPKSRVSFDLVIVD